MTRRLCSAGCTMVCASPTSCLNSDNTPTNADCSDEIAVGTFKLVGQAPPQLLPYEVNRVVPEVLVDNFFGDDSFEIVRVTINNEVVFAVHRVDSVKEIQAENDWDEFDDEDGPPLGTPPRAPVVESTWYVRCLREGYVLHRGQFETEELAIAALPRVVKEYQDSVVSAYNLLHGIQ